ncbi:tRNA lysidine(34) synthetase TilS [Opitutus sp. ER46]|uniref:tRNA lysidine(34) synthetase TilS n=1 Tax=Opitutus sp. ER46 TaxID=2161864 RepID=UPI000D30F2EC|nr:tRNA lysidine(34) synthetase TilS [Opitutus sp. ER46]PTX91073.1 tRNA lysidine(34) synthetase TilS [Opitutus sp. ER46]
MPPPRRRTNSWKTIAATVAAAVPRGRLETSVLRWTETPAARGNWTVGVSGGGDSVLLLLLLWAHWPERRSRLRALHFDHRLRGPSSRADRGFCRRLCAALGVPLTVEAWERPNGSRVRSPSEAEARSARLAFFARHSRVLWLGHHQDDVAESLLMRLARGSGAGGLSAPRPVQPMPAGRVHLRPLLGLRKKEVLAVLEAAGAGWREDESNAGGAYFRNRIRRDVLPRWEKAARRDAVAGAARSRELLAEDDAALERWVDELAVFGRNGDLLLRRLAGRPRAVVRRALHRWLGRVLPGADLSRQAFDALLAAVERGDPTRQSLGRESFGVIRAGRLMLMTGKPSANFQRRVN